jgi:fumarylacetoacetase
MTPPGETDFSIHNLPFGVFETAGGGPRAGIAIGSQIVDLAQLAAQGYFHDLKIPDLSIFSRDSLNAFIALGKPYWRAVRQRVATFLTSNNPQIEQKAAKMLPPVEIGDYVDFYSSEEHATSRENVPRPQQRGMLPAGSICRSATTAAAHRSS